MNRRPAILCTLCVLCGPSDAVQKTNIIFILADDLGYGDLSCYGSDKVATPHLDGMAKEGMRLRSFYVAPVCSPSRAAFMTGSIRSEHPEVAAQLRRRLVEFWGGLPSEEATSGNRGLKDAALDSKKRRMDQAPRPRLVNSRHLTAKRTTPGSERQEPAAMHTFVAADQTQLAPLPAPPRLAAAQLRFRHRCPPPCHGCVVPGPSPGGVAQLSGSPQPQPRDASPLSPRQRSA